MNAPVRHMVQPGEPAAVRRVMGQAPASQTERVNFTAGETLIQAVLRHRPPGSTAGAVFNILPGEFSHIAYCTAVPDPTGHTVATYTKVNHLDDCWLVAGTATLGVALDGGPLLHCHAFFLTSDGAMRGGHLVPDQTLVGTSPSAAWMRSMQGDFEIRQCPDTETNHALFQPVTARGTVHG